MEKEPNNVSSSEAPQTMEALADSLLPTLIEKVEGLDSEAAEEVKNRIDIFLSELPDGRSRKTTILAALYSHRDSDGVPESDFRKALSLASLRDELFFWTLIEKRSIRTFLKT